MILAFGNPVYDEIRTPWVCTRGRVLSGCAVNAALVAARLGETIVVVGRLGRDRLGHYESYLQSSGITAVTEPCAETGGFGLDYDERGNRELQVLGRAEAISTLPPSLDRAAMVFLGPVMQELPFELIRRIRARTASPLVLDPQGLLRRIGADGMIEHFKPTGIEEICAQCDVVKPNELEARILTGIDPRHDAEGAAAILLRWGVPTVVITLAEAGAFVATRDASYRIAAIPTPAIDSTGAGDSFAGGLMVGRLRGMSWPEAAQLATACSSTMIAHCGPDFALEPADALRRAATVAVVPGCAVTVPAR
jgi:sugar/nucleoside kinase (ribokinase family)